MSFLWLYWRNRLVSCLLNWGVPGYVFMPGLISGRVDKLKYNKTDLRLDRLCDIYSSDRAPQLSFTSSQRPCLTRRAISRSRMMESIRKAIHGASTAISHWGSHAATG